MTPAVRDMTLPQLLDGLGQPSAYPHAVSTVEVRQTHISAVFLVGAFVYKVKKPVRLGFLDFSTLALRKFYCDEEVRLNRRLASDVYLGVVPITHTADGWRVEGPGEPIEWAVKMRRLPESATLQSRLERDAVRPEHMRELAALLADFHRRADRGPMIASYGRFEIVAGNARENFTQTQGHIGRTVSAAVHERTRQRTEEHLHTQAALIDARAERGVPCDTHGDLHLDHVYHFPDAEIGGRWVIIDCIEFADRFRYADPCADAAFLVMDLAFRGRRDLAHDFAEAYVAASGDREGHALLPLYSAYRAVVRAKVKGVQAGESEVPPVQRDRALWRARAHWLLALTELEPPLRRPALVLVGGLPGTGKSTLARGLARRAECVVIRSDLVRKELAGLSATERTASGYGAGIYDESWTERTYTETLCRAEALLWEGRRVIVDASFRAESHRRAFLEAARRWGVPALFLHCQASPETTRQRLAARTGDASDADWVIHERVAADWQPTTPATERVRRAVVNEGEIEEVVERACGWLRQEGFA